MVQILLLHCKNGALDAQMVQMQPLQCKNGASLPWRAISDLITQEYDHAPVQSAILPCKSGNLDHAFVRRAI